eukprot:TRINITY_DN40825_c0_g1_i2.p2 TRINITY_DN40825_c0_g1~~TRINITY_DN40825_c0_g1_i2.p2  ORF type:complete len:117 (-),score=28.12 TRINITY_DN40825_c0_g1_i2:224-574(-)
MCIRDRGLDYDIFYMESVVEYFDEGANDRTAVVKALKHTGNIIAVAGVIMLIAFSALLLCSVPVLNQIAFVMSVGVALACFVSTKVVIPTVMGMLPGNANFWPREPAGAVTSEVGK